MEIEFQSTDRIDIKLSNGKTITILHYAKEDEVSIAFGGSGHRNLKQLQNRSDGYSGCTFTKQE